MTTTKNTSVLFISIMFLFACNNDETHKIIQQEKVDIDAAWNAIQSLPDKKSSDKLFSGKQLFCNEDGLWTYEVNVDDYKVTIAVLPGSKNNTYPDKRNPTEIIHGFVVDDNIIASKNDEGVWKQLYWYKDNQLFVLGEEDSEEQFIICK